MHFLTKNNIFLTTAQFVFLSFSVFCKSSSFVKLKKSKHSFKVRMRSYTLISLTCSSLLYAPTRIPISLKEVLFSQAVDQLKEARRSSSAALCPSADLCFKVWLQNNWRVLTSKKQVVCGHFYEYIQLDQCSDGKRWLILVFDSQSGLEMFRDMGVHSKLASKSIVETPKRKLPWLI